MTEIDTAQSKTQNSDDADWFDFEEYADPRVRCAGVARNGRQCRALVNPESRYCHQHRDACGPFDDPMAGVARRLWSQRRQGAKARGIHFTLTEGDVYRMLRSSNGRCAVTDVPFELATDIHSAKRPYFPSIDRIDAQRGYTPANVRLVIAAANIAMNVWGDSVLYRMAECMVKAGKVPGS